MILWPVAQIENKMKGITNQIYCLTRDNELNLKHSRAHFKMPKVCSARSQNARNCYLARS